LIALRMWSKHSRDRRLLDTCDRTRPLRRERSPQYLGTRPSCKKGSASWHSPQRTEHAVQIESACHQRALEKEHSEVDRQVRCALALLRFCKCFQSLKRFPALVCPDPEPNECFSPLVVHAHVFEGAAPATPARGRSGFQLEVLRPHPGKSRLQLPIQNGPVAGAPRRWAQP
jgi:hypothetical protein